MANESFVQVAVDGSGKRVRNVSALVAQPDGSVQTVQMQVVALADENGNQLRLLDDRDLMQQLLDEMRAVRLGMQMLIEWLSPSSSMVTLPPVAPGMRIPVIPTVEDHELIEIARDWRADEDS